MPYIRTAVLPVKNTKRGVRVGRFLNLDACDIQVGRAKNAVIEDCHKLLLTIDGIENSLTIRRCSNLTLALASEMPSINMIRSRDNEGSMEEWGVRDKMGGGRGKWRSREGG
eukprot:3941990-Rhodomonas_salina.1